MKRGLTVYVDLFVLVILIDHVMLDSKLVSIDYISKVNVSLKQTMARIASFIAINYLQQS